MMKIHVIGYGRCGKDTVCEFIQEKFDLKFISSSEFIGEKLIYPKYKEKLNYNSWKECFEDRHSHRSLWFNEIVNYVKDDPAKLAREIFEENDIYCGIRNANELMHSLIDPKLKINAVIWVDRSHYIDPESKSSCNITKEHATHIIDNNGALEDTFTQATSLINNLLEK